MNAADPGRRDENGIGPVSGHPCFNSRLTAQIQVLPAHCQDRAVLSGEAAHDGRAHHAGVAGDPDALTCEIIKHGETAHILGRIDVTPAEFHQGLQ